MQKQSQLGFTLIELSFSIVIIGLMVAGFLQAYTIYDAKRKIEVTELRLTDTNQSIVDYIAREGRLPCPAPMGGRGGGIRFNEEDCGTGNGNLRVAGTGGNMVLIGKYPSAELGISNDYMKDVHGNYLIYAVTEAATNASTFAGASGAIIILEKGVEDDPGAVDFGEIQLLSTHANVQYAVVSSGSNGYGAYAYDGAQSDLEPCDGDINDEQENCDGDATFKVSVRSDSEDSNIYYDDRILFESNVANLLPQTPASCEQVDSFVTNAIDCPDGWEAENSISQAIHVPRRYYNVDTETGDYYFTKVETPNTVYTSRLNNEISINSGAPPLPQKLCKKSTGNTKKTKCFSNKIILDPGYPRPGTQNSTVTARDCPDGWEDTGDIVHVGTSSRHSSSQDATFRTELYGTTCVK